MREARCCALVCGRRGAAEPLYVVSATFCSPLAEEKRSFRELSTPRVRVGDEERTKMIASSHTLSYGSRQTYSEGLADIIHLPLLTMQMEWNRDYVWSLPAVHQGAEAMTYTLRGEWRYVNGPAYIAPAAGHQQGDRDETNVGATPEQFLERANAHIRERRGQDATALLLTLQEVLAIRLYSGPAFRVINEFLRQIGQLSGRFRLAVARDPSFTFAATVRHLCDGLRKLSAVATDEEMSVPLYRGVRGELAAQFWQPDELGMICATESTFMSTTRDPMTAIGYMAAVCDVPPR
jgi:hypothetical protein